MRFTENLTVDELKSEFRDFKLKVLSDEVKFMPITKVGSELEDKLDFIHSQFPGDIISGSLGLTIMSMLHREVNDIDILITDHTKYTGYVLDGYDDELHTPNRLGYITFSWKKNIFKKSRDYYVDFFKNDATNYINFEYKGKVLRVHHPLEIIQFKFEMTDNTKISSQSRQKHIGDLTRIFGQTTWQLALRGEFDI
jgi:hypothetical protein